MKIVPAIDLCGGRVVRLRQGDFAHERVFAHDAATLAQRYVEAGAEWIHVVDLDGARNGAPAQLGRIAEIASTGARVQAGGGVRARADVECLRASGVERVVVGSLAVREPATFAAWLAESGADAFCLALDLRVDAGARWRLVVDAWRGEHDADGERLLDRLTDAGLRHVLCTDIARDGMRGGPNLALYRELAARWPNIAWIASGGVRDAGDIAALSNTGVAGCVVGSALLDGTLALEEIAACSRAA